MSMTKEEFGVFAKQLALYVIAQKYDKPVVLLENLDDREKKLPVTGCCVVCARGRNIPITESKNITFERADIEKLKEAEAAYCNLVPLLVYVCVDEMEKVPKIRLFFAELQDIEDMKEDSVIGFLNQSKGGITLRYTEGKIVQWLTEIKSNNNKLQYVELELKSY